MPQKGQITIQEIFKDIADIQNRWMICHTSFTTADGEEIQRGKMRFIEKGEQYRPSNYWRRASPAEYQGMKCHKGNYYNHNI
jgi:hypothetical protein